MMPKLGSRTFALLLVLASSELYTSAAVAQSTPVIISPSMPTGVIGQSYYQQLNALGGTPPYTWSQVAGTLPAGTTFSSSGVLSGNPSVAGVYGFSLEVTDKNQAKDRKDFSVIISSTSSTQPVSGLT